MRWQPLPIVGPAYADDTRPWSVQDTVNYLPIQAEVNGTRSPSLLRCAPGLVDFATTGAGAPVRGLHNVEGTLFCVAGGSLYRVNPDATVASLGTIPGVGPVSMAHNQIAGGNQLAIAANGSGYVYNTVLGSLAQITDSGFPGAVSFAYINQAMIGVDASRNFAFASDNADATSYNTLNRFQAESQPDKLVGGVASHGEAWLFGERTIQPFQDTGATQGRFQAAQNEILEVGCANGNTICALDNAIFWLGNDGIVYRNEGYTQHRVSTHPIEQRIAQGRMLDAFAFTFEDRGHKVYYLTLPGGETWGYDCASQLWHRRQSYGLSRWRVNALCYWNGKWIAGDYANGKLYTLDWNTQGEGSQVMERSRVFRAPSDSQNPIIVNGLEIVADAGEPSNRLTSMDLRYSKDGGRNWSDWRKLDFAATGDFQARAQMRRFGRGRDWVLDVRMTDPVRADIMSAGWLPEACDD